MPRNYGLSHVIPRVSPRANSPGLTARLLYPVERLFQCAPYSLCKTHRPSGQQVSVHVSYMGRVLFAHGVQVCTAPDQSLTHVRGEK